MSETTPAGGAPNRVDAARPRSMAERVQRLRRQGFVGRAEERRAFASALRGGPDDPRLLLLHGPGGIGKSALLRRLADDADDLGHAAVWVHGEYVESSATMFAEAAAPAWTSDRPVLFVDGFEHCHVLETWLREVFLPMVPEDTVVVVAGRQRPDPQWTNDPVGHPLALCLAAEVAAEGPVGDDSAWEPSPDVVESLLARMIDRAPSPAHQYGLRVCGHIRHVTVDLLRTGMIERDALVVFDWLAGLPYVEPGSYGLVAHEHANPLARVHGDGLRAAVVAAAEAAAARLGLPYGTYRRHLRAGVQQLCDALWQPRTTDLPGKKQWTT